MSPLVYVVATCDTKGVEARFLVERLSELGVETRLVDAECSSAGGDRGAAVNTSTLKVTKLVSEAHARGELAGVLGIGGSAGTTIATAAMRALPIGVPKLMVSTLASGPVRTYVRDKDVLMLNSVVDIAGLNRISRSVLGSAAAAMAGMVKAGATLAEPGERPLVAATMFGVTTPCVDRARAVLEEAGYEVVVFHATGNGGEALESLVREGVFEGVLDVTTTELADELVGGVLSAGPERLTAAAEAGVPQVVSVGALDMVNFQAQGTVPERFAGRRFHEHNANVTLMRTTREECAQLGVEIGAKVARSAGPAAVLLPARGVSAIDRTGQPFDDPAAREALFEALRSNAGAIECAELDHHINDPEFAEAAARRLLELMRG